jgi:hypothetical protein
VYGKVIRYGIGLSCGGAAAIVAGVTVRGIYRHHGGDLRDTLRCPWVGDCPVESIQRSDRRSVDRSEGAADRSRAGARVLALCTATSYFVALILADWWNPASWLSSAESIGGAVERTIRSWVETVIQAAMSLVDDAFALADAVFTDLINTLSAFVDAVWGDLSALADQFDHFVSVGVADIEQWAIDMVTTTANALESLWNDALHAAESIYDDAIADLRDAVTFVENELIAPIDQWIDSAASWLGSFWDSAWNVVYDNVIAPLLQTATDAWQWASTFADWWVTGVEDEWAIIRQAWDWIVAMALHPESAVLQLISDVESEATLKTILSYAESATDDIATWTDKAVSWLGA